MIIFLDFDGVLHPFFPLADNSDEKNAFFCDLPVLASVLAEYPTSQVVISSSWRTKYSLTQLRELLGPVVGERVVGVTPVSQEPNSPQARAKEIMQWIAAHAPSQSWVALDDMEDLFFPDSPLIICPDAFGQSQAAALKNALDHPLEPIARPGRSASQLYGQLWVPTPRS